MSDSEGSTISLGGSDHGGFTFSESSHEPQIGGDTSEDTTISSADGVDIDETGYDADTEPEVVSEAESEAGSEAASEAGEAAAEGGESGLDEGLELGVELLSDIA